VSILKLLGRELMEEGWRRFVILAIISGLSGAVVLATINLAATSMRDVDVMVNSLIILIIAIVLYVYSQKSLMVMAALLAEQTVHGLRVRLLRTLKAAELIEIEGLSRNEIFSCINSEMRVISDGATSMMIIAQSVVLTAVTMVYLAMLSLVALLMAVVFIGIAAYIHMSRNRQIIDEHERLFQLNTEMMNGFGDFIDGFKEVKLNTARSEELTVRVGTQSAVVSSRQLEMQNLFSLNFVASQVTFFLLTGMMVFVLPLFGSVEPPTLVKITATTLFLIGPISAVVGGLPAVQRMNSAADAILALQGKLSEIKRWSPTGQAAISEFAWIGLAGATFRYPAPEGENAFMVGPIDMRIDRGQVVFITGGNGSGKSTLLKMITSLYLPTSGAVALDGRPMQGNDVVAYRNLFSAIFSDNHLFKEFYGIPAVDPKAAAGYLELMEVARKVTIVGRSFSTLALSSGQRKRLAMIVALLEDRPIYVFDEWAADQDPYFRKKFYREILPMLKSKGKTVIAVTHDERYFDAADIRFHMEEGGLQRVSASAGPDGNAPPAEH
jgi:putative pyoverdin transport system ATP-binding/permease protein